MQVHVRMYHIIVHNHFLIFILYSQSASFRCPHEKCAGNGDFIRLHVVGASEASTMRNDLHCMVCGHKLEEDVKYRILGGKFIHVCVYVCVSVFVHICVYVCM